MLDSRTIPLSELDRQVAYGHRTSVYVPPAGLMDRSRFTFADLVAIMARLRRPGDGCPWDMKQTHETLRQYIIEEAYEAVDAIHSGDALRIADELGDVLLQVAFHAQIAREHASFTIDDVTTAVCAKMIARHAHIWGDVRCETPEEVLASWESIKKAEKGLKQTVDMMRDIPMDLPQLMRAYKVQNKARQTGFDWDSPLDALDKVMEEAAEVREAIASGAGVEMELGDLLFAATNVARLAGLQPEVALGRSTDKFITRFHRMEQAVLTDGKELSELSLPEMDVYWDAVKMQEEQNG
ncbi:MAG: nucleoside triphosphate pyrophosphohydrolase [Clostridia bacterium]|nr:nucleoside triphosphate pyrophosphohydrolase [Clostridia bacterium]